MNATAPRWNARQAAADYDAAAPRVHPCYDDVQHAVIAALALDANASPHVVDLGGGSGRLVERLLERLPHGAATVVDPSSAFLRLATQRLERFAGRARVCRCAAEEDWRADIAPPDAIVSTSALHHLDGAGKNAAFAECHAALPAGGVFVNGDEYRPPSDVAYRELLEEWRDHMRSSLAAGLIPETFASMVDRWEERNLHRFGEAREPGDDCHETVEEQIARLYGAGFANVRVTWRDRLWAVLVARK